MAVVKITLLNTPLLSERGLQGDLEPDRDVEE